MAGTQAMLAPSGLSSMQVCCQATLSNAAVSGLVEDLRGGRQQIVYERSVLDQKGALSVKGSWFCWQRLVCKISVTLQVSAVLAFFLFAGLYCYAELLEYARR